jgi:hypothetical protein
LINPASPEITGLPRQSYTTQWDTIRRCLVGEIGQPRLRRPNRRRGDRGEQIGSRGRFVDEVDQIGTECEPGIRRIAKREQLRSRDAQPKDKFRVAKARSRTTRSTDQSRARTSFSAAPSWTASNTMPAAVSAGP